MARQLTIRGVSDDVHRRLEAASRERGQSVNATVIELLERTFDAGERRQRLSRLATWTEEEGTAFDQVLAAQRAIDDEAWR